MKSGIETTMVAERYARMSNEELIGQVTLNAAGMTPEAIEIARKEIVARGLNPRLAEAVAVQNREWTEDDIAAYCDLISKQSCPHCGKNDSRLNGTESAETMSFLLFTSFKRKLVVGCKSCLNKAVFGALGKSFVLGWWGIPWGLLRTPQSIFINLNNLRFHSSKTHNECLQRFVTAHRGELAAIDEDAFDWDVLDLS
ncbi:hypothetical protein ACFOTA_05560 [Chitinophaga sp. GCM10012297]|uniref:Uncharacterized protein n=1 Tax=Chitinophaga chungangae TaxID=2821488 RepID=A0ABS3YAF7_9BACT|nr:hypothetical protein [Chitinophaga chungangae]MBO9151663.1 hypothetical protein [Chitinophaga chungangae]